MYVKQYRGLSTSYTSTQLCEMSAAEYRRARAADTDDRVTLRVDARQAHRWVRDGRPHSTYLWVDHTGRIRHALRRS